MAVKKLTLCKKMDVSFSEEILHDSGVRKHLSHIIKNNFNSVLVKTYVLWFNLNILSAEILCVTRAIDMYSLFKTV